MKTMMEAAPAGILNGTAPQVSFTAEVAAEAAPQAAFVTEVAAETAPPSAPRTRHTQPVQQAATVAAVGAMLAGLQTAAEPLRSLLEQDGITAACITACTAQHAAALAARDARQRAIAAERQAVATLNAAIEHATFGMTALRQVARMVFSDGASHLALGLNEELSRSPALFVNEARRVLALAQQPPYIEKLTAAAYSAPRLQEMAQEIDAVEAAYGVRQDAGQLAQRATLVRDAEFAHLGRLARQVRVQVKAILRRNPTAPRPAGLI